MIKAGTTPTPPRDELRPPAWLALAQVLFAAILLYVIRNPVSIDNVSQLVMKRQQPEPALVIYIPLSTVAVAAPKPVPDNLPM